LEETAHDYNFEEGEHNKMLFTLVVDRGEMLFTVCFGRIYCRFFFNNLKP